ncbi:MAG: hypothetical protein LBV15_02735 [Planctomycetota bacterium]|jgi:hypothetical protein|nr:hypothetical protein [Planctomycetota bacterium]
MTVSAVRKRRAAAKAKPKRLRPAGKAGAELPDCPLCRKYGLTPNAETIRAMEDSLAGRNTAAATLEELRELWRKA